MSDIEQVYRNMYASVPAYERTEIVHNLSKAFNFEGVPGFYLDNNIWLLNMNYTGFYIPYRDEKGRVVGLQIRRDEEVKDKYIWVSSGEKEKGTSSGSPLHFVNVEEVKASKVIYLTEGGLKADIIGHFSGVGLCASAGVNSVKAEKLLDSVFEVFPDLEKVVVAYDMDWQTKEKVRLALIRLLDALKDRDIKAEVAVWDLSLGKGLDDVLVNEAFTEDSVKYIPADGNVS